LLRPRQRKVLLGRHEPVELGANGVDAPPVLRDRRRGPRGGRISPSCLDERSRIVLDVRRAGLRDLPCPTLLLRIAGNETFQCPGLIGKSDLGSPPLRQDVVLSCNEKTPLARVDVDHEPLQPVGGDEDGFGLACALLRLLQVRDGEQQDREGRTDHEREHSARDDHAAGQPARHPSLRCGLRGLLTGRDVSRERTP
jgi:hypothetical protein